MSLEKDTYAGEPEQEPEIIDAVPSGEIVKIDKGPEFGVALYQGAAMLKITPEEAAILEAPRDEEAELDILPTGEVYMPQIHYRRCLSKAFGAGQWALIPRGGYIQEGNTLSREFALYVRGHYVSEAVGEQEWFPCKEDDSRQSMSKATAAESLKSNALMRVCKDLGIASECWDKRFTERFKAKYCVQVWCKGKSKPQWRRKDSPPFWNENGQAESRAPQSDPPSRPAPQAERPPAQPQASAPVTDMPGLKMTVAGARKAGEGRSEKGPWTRYEVEFDGGKRASTFSKTVCDKAEAALKNNWPVMVELGSKQTTKGDKTYTNYSIKSLELVPGAPPEDAETREDGQPHMADDLPF